MDRGHADVMREHPSQASPREFRHAILRRGIVEGVGSVLSAEAHVHVEPAPSPIHEGAADERREQVTLGGNLSSEQPEQEGFVRRLDRVLVADVHLVLGHVVLAAPTLDVEPARDSRPNDLVDDTVRVDGGSGSVDTVPGGPYRAPPVLAVGLQQVELELERELRMHAALLPGLDRPPEDLARVQGTRLPSEVHVCDADHGVLVPSWAEGGDVEGGLDVWQPDVELEPRHREDLPVQGQWVDGDAEGRLPAAPVAVEPLAPL